jgi:endonuclease YncB( thermonuclease family)
MRSYRNRKRLIMSEDKNVYYYNAEVKRIVDGDTFDILIDLGFDTFRKGRVRLYGVNTPESRTRNLEEKKNGISCKRIYRSMVARIQ